MLQTMMHGFHLPASSCYLKQWEVLSGNCDVLQSPPACFYTDISVSSSMTFVHNDLLLGKRNISLQFFDHDMPFKCKQAKQARQMPLQNKTATCQQVRCGERTFQSARRVKTSRSFCKLLWCEGRNNFHCYLDLSLYL